MKQAKQAGMSGKGFYAALSLSVAMVGAACWYAWSEADRLRPDAKPQSSIAAAENKPRMTAPVQTVPAVTLPQQTQPAPAVTDEAEKAAAILRHRTEPVTEAAPVTAMTTAIPPADDLPQAPMLPVSGRTIQPFSQGELVRSATTGIWSTHNGTDLAVPLGTEILCTEDGTVTFAGRDALFGATVAVLHENGAVTRYCGLNDSLNVQAGDLVQRGAVLGTVGDTNESERAEEPHLHFEVLQNDRYIDPDSYFAGALSVPKPEQ